MTSDRGGPSDTTLETYGGSEAIAESIVGNTLTISPTNEDALFPNATTVLTTTLIIEGKNTGARKTLQIIVNKS